MEEQIIICFDVIFFLKQKDLLNWCVFCRFMFARVIESYRSVAEDGLKLEKVVCGRYLYLLGFFSLLLLFVHLSFFLVLLSGRSRRGSRPQERCLLVEGQAQWQRGPVPVQQMCYGLRRR